MSKIQFDVDIAIGVAIDVANDVLPVWWMEVYPFHFSPSKSLLHAEIKCLANHHAQLLYYVIGWRQFGISLIGGVFQFLDLKVIHAGRVCALEKNYW